METAPRERGRTGSVATGLLVVMAVAFLIAQHFEPMHPALPWVRSFAEAAMVGALADWFAVVALFRHPLGVPIPHTAIVPRNKDRIARNLATFVETNFLVPAVVREKIAGVDLAGSFAEWLIDAERPRKLAERAADRIPGLLTALGGDLRERLQRTLEDLLRDVDVAPIAGELLLAVTADGRHHHLVDQLIEELARLLAEYEPAIRAKVRDKTAWLWRSLRTDVTVSDKIIAAAEEVIAEMSRDRQHPWREKFDAVLAELAGELKTSPVYRQRLDALKAGLLEHPAFHRYLSRVWDGLQEAVAADVAGERSLIAHALERGIASLGETLASDEATRGRLNRWLRSAIVRVVETQRHEIGQLIADTIGRWDTGTFTDRIESYVGDDLQYIRINGTVIGGLIGLGLHGVSLLIT